jgi:hypothetical protein
MKTQLKWHLFAASPYLYMAGVLNIIFFCFFLFFIVYDAFNHEAAWPLIFSNCLFLTMLCAVRELLRRVRTELNEEVEA